MSNPSKTALVTGASAGIGRAVAEILLANNYQVVLTGRREALLKEVVEESGCDSENALCVAGDIGRDEDVENLFAQTMEKFGRLDVLFNNAGISAKPLEIDELAIEDWRRVLNTNLHGAFLCARKAFGIMKNQDPQGGRIINNGSISAYLPRPKSVPYTVTKHAISGLTRCLALDGRPYSIACGQIDIGNAGTDMAAPLGKGTVQANGSIMAEPLMDVAHVATSVLHMAELPLDANVLFMNVMATNMPFVGRG